MWTTVNFQLYVSTSDVIFLSDALEGALTGLLLSVNDPLPFLLKVISILFNPNCPRAHQIFSRKFRELPAAVWISVLPQILAKINVQESRVRNFVHAILCAVGTEFPHVVFYHLALSLRSMDRDVRANSEAIWQRLEARFPSLPSALLGFVGELIRIARSPWEIWQAAIDEAIPALGKCEELYALKAQLEAPPETFLDRVFQREFGPDLNTAFDRLGIENTVGEGIGILGKIQRRLRHLLPELDELPLRFASPVLNALNNSEVAVPGDLGAICIKEMEKVLVVLKTKHRPRRIGIIGSDGIVYRFVLSAGKDVRLDQRIMQLFGFVNTLLRGSNLPLKQRLLITQFKVLPLTLSVGLTSWIDDCATLGAVIRSQREKSGVSALAEDHQAMVESSGRFFDLEMSERLPIFTKAAAATKADDIAKTILRVSADSVHWLELRSNYTASLATTSMVNYVLGLGDRHPDNVAFIETSGRLMHIDFVSACEGATKRRNFPETVPFRLTRLMIGALEVSKIEGTFRRCCENVMRLLRPSAEEITEMLQVFLYAPLTPSNAEYANVDSGDLARISERLRGKEGNAAEGQTVEAQVDGLITAAINPENLSMMWRGWMPWW
jgi:FKBP12-rapamycin complex-associated protein